MTPPDRPILSSHSIHEYSWIQEDALAQEYCLQLLGRRAEEAQDEELKVGAGRMTMISFSTATKSEQRFRPTPCPRNVVLAVIFAAVVLRMR